MNKVFLIGRITKDLELKATPQGKSVCQFTLAVNRKHKNENGVTEADFINCIVWDKQAENLVRYQKKGNQIAIEGTIRTRNYEDNSGKKVYVTEVFVSSIAFLESKNNNIANLPEPPVQEEIDLYQQFGNSIEAQLENQEADNQIELPF